MAKVIDYTTLTPEELIKVLSEKDAQLASKDSELATSQEVIGELKSDLAAKEDEISALLPIVKVGKDSYDIVIPIFKLYDAKEQVVTEYTAADVQKNEKLAALLVKIGSGVLVKRDKI